MPQFQSEAEEARGWFDHQDEIAEEFLASQASRHFTFGATASEMNLPLRLLIGPEDIPVVEQQARNQGLPFDGYDESAEYDEYAKRLFRGAVQAEELRRAG